jgi:uncharacterized protein DUF1706
VTSTITKGDVLDAIQREQADWDALLAEVGEDRMLEPGPVAGWSFKDLIAHLVAWDARALARIDAQAQGRPEPDPGWPQTEDTDLINAWIDAQHQDRLLGEVLEDSRELYPRLSAIVELLPDEALNAVGVFSRAESESLAAAIINGAFFSHLHEEHEPAIREWLAHRGAPAREGPAARVEL